MEYDYDNKVITSDDKVVSLTNKALGHISSLRDQYISKDVPSPIDNISTNTKTYFSDDQIYYIQIGGLSHVPICLFFDIFN